jgi:hypothetical protein
MILATKHNHRTLNMQDTHFRTSNTDYGEILQLCAPISLNKRVKIHDNCSTGQDATMLQISKFDVVDSLASTVSKMTLAFAQQTNSLRGGVICVKSINLTHHISIFFRAFIARTPLGRVLLRIVLFACVPILHCTAGRSTYANLPTAVHSSIVAYIYISQGLPTTDILIFVWIHCRFKSMASSKRCARCWTPASKMSTS